MNGPPLRMPPPPPPKPPAKEIPPVRMGDRSDLVRQQKAKAEEKHKADAKIRTRIYQDILALLDLAERLTMDLSAHEDRYGIEWNGLARQIHAQYHADIVKIVPAFQDKIMSKEGAQGLPKGLYRALLDFADACAAFLKRPENDFMEASQRFKKACVEMRQQICIFENERPANEESFFS